MLPHIPSAHILALPHPNLLSVTLTWLQMEKSKGWAACTFGSRLILVSWLYLFSLLLPLYSLTTRTAWLVILNRTPDLSTKVSSFNTSLGKRWSGGKRSEKEEVPAGRRESRGQDIAPGCTGHSPNLSLLTGHHWTYEGEIGSGDGLALLSPQDPLTWHEDLSWGRGRGRAFPELHPPAPLFSPYTHRPWGLHKWLLDPAVIIKSHIS